MFEPTSLITLHGLDTRELDRESIPSRNTNSARRTGPGAAFFILTAQARWAAFFDSLGLIRPTKRYQSRNRGHSGHRRDALPTPTLAPQRGAQTPAWWSPTVGSVAADRPVHRDRCRSEARGHRSDAARPATAVLACAGSDGRTVRTCRPEGVKVIG